MRIPVSLRGIFLFLALTSPVLLSAQFQTPTDEELKMTSDPKAPGAAAVYLNIDENDNDPAHMRTYYARIKVLTEKGKELATVEIPYVEGGFKIEEIKGRTIHSDGTVIPLVGKPEDLMTAKSGDTTIGRKVFTLPSVEVGSILEYRFEVNYGESYWAPRWDVQKPYFVHKEHYQYTPFRTFMPGNNLGSDVFLVDQQGRPVNFLLWWMRLPTGSTVRGMGGSSGTGYYGLDVTDIPPAPDEEWMPPIPSLLYKVHFYYINASSTKDFWVQESKRWSKEEDKFAEPSRSLQEAVSGLVAPGDSDLVKAQKLYAAVQALDNTDYSRAKTQSEMKELNIKEAKHAQDTWSQKSGSSEDIAMLYLAMLRAAGLTAYAVKVVDRDEGIFDPSFMNIDQLDDTLVILSVGGKQILLDPGQKMCPFQTVSWKHSGTQGIRQSPQGDGLTDTPDQAYTANTTIRTGDITVDADGSITGDIRIVMSGQQALVWRQLALQNDMDEVTRRFERDLQATVPAGVEAHVDHFLGMDQPDQNLMVIVKVKGTLGTAAGKRLILPAYFFETRGNLPFVNEPNRQTPVDMHYGDLVTDQLTYHLPAGMTVEGAPQDAKILWAAHSVYTAKSKADPGQIIVARSLARAFSQAKPEEYQDLRGFYQKVAAADQQQMVLTTAPAAAGN